MKQYILILLVLGIILISGCVNQMVSEIPCNWVYKTNRDYSDLLGGGFNFETRTVAKIPAFSSGREKLDEGYVTAIYFCSDNFVAGSVFFNITLNEWENGDSNYRSRLLAAINSNPNEYIVDTNPFTELYFCMGKSESLTLNKEQINEIINNNNLDIECERII